MIHRHECPYCGTVCTAKALSGGGWGQQVRDKFRCLRCGAREIDASYDKPLLPQEYQTGWHQGAPFINQNQPAQPFAVPQPQEPTGMNYSSAIFLTNPAVKAVSVSYDIDAEGKGKAPFYTFKTFETFSVGDYVVVPTKSRHGMTVVRVETVGVEVDPTSSVELKWIVGRVDKDTYDEVLRREQGMIAKIKSAKARREREKLAEELMADNPELRDMAMLTAPSASAPVPDFADLSEAPIPGAPPSDDPVF